MQGDSKVRLTHVSTLEEADPEALVFVANPKYLPQLREHACGRGYPFRAVRQGDRRFQRSSRAIRTRPTHASRRCCTRFRRRSLAFIPAPWSRGVHGSTREFLSGLVVWSRRGVARRQCRARPATVSLCVTRASQPIHASLRALRCARTCPSASAASCIPAPSSVRMGSATRPTMVHG